MTKSWFNRFLPALTVGVSMLIAHGQPASADMAPPDEQFMSMGTSSAGGSFFPLAGAMANVIGKAYPQLKINAEITGGSVDNVKLIHNGQLELALISAQPAYQGYHGLGKFDSTGPLESHRALMAGHGNFWQLYTLKSSGIETIYDLKGKTVSLGATGSDGNSIGKLVIEAHGLKMNEDWRPEYISHGNGPGALRDGRVDAVLILSSAPTSAVTDITSTNGDEVVFVNPDPKVLKGLLDQFPYWSAGAIPAGTYNGHDEDITGTFKLAVLLCASKDVSDEVAYAVVKALIENNAALTSANALGKYWSRDDAVGPLKGVIPIHPGAEKYYRDNGLM